MRRDDFIFTVGFDGDTAIVDSVSKRRFGRHTPRQLAENGFYKAAMSAAMYDKSEEDTRVVLSIYNQGSEHPVQTVELLKRVLGVSEVPVESMKVQNL